MATNELVCPLHGPYPAYLGICPVCSGKNPQRPPEPIPLDQDDLPTEIGAKGRGTMGRATADYDYDNAPTEIPARRRGGSRILDPESEEDTQLGRHGRRELDETELYAMPTGALAILWVKEGPRRGQIYKIREEAHIGRENTDIVLDDIKVSKQHAKIILEKDQYVIWDFGSKNGTFVNGERIRAATPLKENDVIKIGEMLFVLKILD